MYTVTKPAPEFEATAVADGEIKTIRLTDFKGKYLVFFFYPLDLYACLLFPLSNVI